MAQQQEQRRLLPDSDTSADTAGTERHSIRTEELSDILRQYEVIAADELQLYLEHRDEGKVRLTVDNFNSLKPGDIVELSYYQLWHMIIVESVRTQPDKPPGFVVIGGIHYGRPDLLTPNRIIRETFERNLNTDECWLQLLPPSGCYPSEAVLRRARSRLNEEQHSPVSNNAAQFALWCKIQSSSSRPESLVPIFLSDEHETHELKAGDHLEIRCHGDKRIHGEVTDAVGLGGLSLLRVLAREDHVKSSAIPFVHQTQQRLDADVPCLISRPESVGTAELIERLNCTDGLIYKSKLPSLSVCLLLTDSHHRGMDWMQRIAYTESYIQNSPIIKHVNPCVLKPGDIIYWQDVYRVVMDVKPDGSATQVTTVQFCLGPVQDRFDLFELKALTQRRETDTLLCVHNDPVLDCHLYGGGRDKPSYKTIRVTDARQIHKGDVISLSSSGFYQHAVVVRSSTDGQDPEPTESICTKASLDVMSYVLDPSLSVEQFEIALRKIDVDIEKQKIFLVVYSVVEECRHSNDEVVSRAFSRQGERQHNLMWNNGRDFARWCSIRHPSNREQCRVTIKSARQLVEFKAGHVKFSKFLRPYTHDAILRSCSSVDGCEDIVKVCLYENNHAFRAVREVALHISDTEEIRRVRYDGFDSRDLRCLDGADSLIGCTFLNANDDSLGWTQLSMMYGSRVTCWDFCYWLKTLKRHEGLQDIQKLFGSLLCNIQADLRNLRKHGVLSSQSDVSVSLENRVTRDHLRQFDHVILSRKVSGQDADVHFILTEWDAESGTGTGVTYELPPEEEKMGFKEFTGFLRVTGPGQIEKVVHSSELNWDMIDAKFEDCLGSESYNLLKNNCEHFVNFLIYGRYTSLQLSDVASTVASYSPSFAQQFAQAVGKFASLFNRLVRIFTDLLPSVPDGRTFWAESISVALVLGFSALELSLLAWRQATTGVSDSEVLQRRRTILTNLCSTLAGLGLAIGLGITSFLPLFGISTAALTLPRIPAIVEALSCP